MSSVGTGADTLGPEATHEPVERHFKLPHGIFLREATSVTVDSDDNVYVFNRGNIPVLVFDSSGNLINDWGNDSPYDGTERCESPWATDAFNGPGTQSPASISRYRGTEYVRPHMIRFSKYDDTLWLVDDMANTISAIALVSILVFDPRAKCSARLLKSRKQSVTSLSLHRHSRENCSIGQRIAASIHILERSSLQMGELSI